MREIEKIYNIERVLRKRNIIARVLFISACDCDLFCKLLFRYFIIEFLLFEIYISSIYLIERDSAENDVWKQILDIII